jgi:hypothetical protein
MLMAIFDPLSLSGVAGIKGMQGFCLCKTNHIKTQNEQGEEIFHAIYFSLKYN